MLSCEPPPALAVPAEAVPATLRALGLSAAARASATSLPGSLMARFTLPSMTGRPAKRSRSRTGTSAAKMAASARAMTAGSSHSILPEPWGSTIISMPADLPACSRPSAAMKVWAMPVGQDVTATISFFLASLAAGATGAATTGAAAGVFSSGAVAWFTRSTICCGVVALRRPSRNSERISERASMASRVRCASSEPSDAAIMNARSAGPSAAPNSTLGLSRAKARVLVWTAAERQCGIAIPPPRPVTAFSSRARASAARPAASARPVFPTRAAIALMTSVLVLPRSASSRTSSEVMSGSDNVVPSLWMGTVGKVGSVSRRQ